MIIIELEGRIWSSPHGQTKLKELTHVGHQKMRSFKKVSGTKETESLGLESIRFESVRVLIKSIPKRRNDVRMFVSSTKSGVGALETKEAATLLISKVEKVSRQPNIPQYLDNIMSCRICN